MKAKFYRFAKKGNSTLVPVDRPGEYIERTIKINDAASSILAPAIRVELGGNNLLQCNYCHIDAFNRYYYISDWHFNADGTWTAFCTVDALGSYAQSIKNSAGYVGRAAGTYDEDIIDAFYPAKSEFLSKFISYDTGLDADLGDGCVVLGIISADAPNCGAVSYYILTANELTTLVQKLVGVGSGASSVDFSTVDTITGDVLKSLVNPFQFVVSCKWFPFSANRVTYTSRLPEGQTIKVYNWNSGINPKKLAQSEVIIENNYVPLKVNEYVVENEQTHVQSIATDDSIDMDDYPQAAPYTSYSMITPWGTFDLDSNVMRDLMKEDDYNDRKIHTTLRVNLISGTATLIIDTSHLTSAAAGNRTEDRYFEFLRREVDLAVDIPLSQVSFDYVSIAKSGLAAVGAAGNIGGWIGNPVGTAADVASATIDAVAGSMSPSAQSSTGAAAAITADIQRVTIQTVSYKTIGKSPLMFGRPLKRAVTQLSSVVSSGATFVKVDYSEFSNSDCLEAERESIIDALKDGVYLE